jgi:hypothetical protein
MWINPLLDTTHRQVFGNRNGLIPLGSTQEDDDPDGLLAKVKIQAAKRRADKLTARVSAAERTTTEEQGEYAAILWTWWLICDDPTRSRRYTSNGTGG